MNSRRSVVWLKFRRRTFDRLKIYRTYRICLKNIFSKKAIVQSLYHFFSGFLKVLGVHPANTKNNRVIRVLWWFYLINHVALLVPSVYTFYTINDVISVSNLCIKISIFTESIFLLMTFRYHEPQFKVLLQSSKTQLFEKKFLTESDDLYLYVVIGLCIVFMCFFEVYIYISESQQHIKDDFIAFTKYPFPLDSLLITALINLHQLLSLIHASIIVVYDGTMILLMYVCTMRLKKLKFNCKNVKDYFQLKECILDHQKILSLVDKINQVASLVILKSTAVFVTYSVSAGLLIFKQRSLDSMTFPFAIFATAFLRIYMSAENAENMISANNEILLTIYSSQWYEEERNIIFMKITMIRRCQKPPKIYVNGFMPMFNRKYFAKVLSLTFSYFMMIRAIVAKKKDVC